VRIKKRKQFDPNAKGSKKITERTESRYKDKKEEMEDEELIITREVLQKLQRRNEAEVLPFVEIFAANRKARKRCEKLQREVQQLRNKTAEVSGKNVGLMSALTRAQEENVKAKTSKENSAKVSRLQEELAEAHKKNVEVMEMASTSNREKEQAKSELETTATELKNAKAALKNLRESCANLENELKTALKAAEIAGKEAEARVEDRLAAIARAEKLEKENQQLVERVMEMKMKEAEKMNEINDLYEDLQRQKKASELKSIANEMNATASASMRGLSLESASSPGFGDSFVGSIPSRDQFHSQTNQGATHRVSFVRSGETLGACGDDKRVALVNANSGQVSSYLEGALGSLLDLSFSPDDNFCLACGTDKAIQLWELSSGRVRHRMTGHADKVVGVEFCRMDKQRAISCSHDRTIREWDLHKGICMNSTPCASNVNTVVYGDTSQFVLSGHLDGGVRIWDLRSRGGPPTNEKKGVHEQQVTSIQLLPNEREILTCGRDNVIRILDCRMLEVSGEFSASNFRVGTNWTNPCFSPNQSHIACGGADGAVFIWSATDRVLRSTLRKHDAVVATTAWGPHGLASCDKNGKCILWR